MSCGLRVAALHVLLTSASYDVMSGGPFPIRAGLLGRGPSDPYLEPYGNGMQFGR
jgi:hypothetical protein